MKAAHWTEEAARTTQDETKDRPLLPEHICENEAASHEWHAERLNFLRDHLDPSEVYRLAAPPVLRGPDYSDNGDDSGPYARRICDSPEIMGIRNPDQPV